MIQQCHFWVYKTLTQKYARTPMFIAALFTMAEIQK